MCFLHIDFTYHWISTIQLVNSQFSFRMHFPNDANDS